MSLKNCDRDCSNQSNCPFRIDPFDPYKEVCVNCGHVFNFRRNQFPLLLLIVWAIAVMVLLMNNPNPKTESQPKTQTPSQELNFKL